MGSAMIRVLATTGCRSDFDLLAPVYTGLAGDARFQFGLVVGGAHLSDRFGRTVEVVRATGLPIVAEIDSFVDTGERDSRPLSAAQWTLRAAPVFQEFRPDVILACGDREDALATCMLGAYLRMPVAHFFGGDHGETRDVDNLARHACSKLASLHFVATRTHRDRLLAIGEPADRIHVVGSPALDAFREIAVASRTETLARRGACDVGDRPYAVVIHHPTFSEPDAGAREIDLILRELTRRKTPAFVGLPNIDAGSREILDALDRWKNVDGVHVFAGLDRADFINLLRHAAVLVGNSSLGLLEAPSLPLAAVNVGERQRGRTAARNVIFVDAEAGAIRKGLDKALSSDFSRSLNGLENPYGDGRSAARVIDILARVVHPDLADKSFDPLD